MAIDRSFILRLTSVTVDMVVPNWPWKIIHETDIRTYEDRKIMARIPAAHETVAHRSVLDHVCIRPPMGLTSWGPNAATPCQPHLGPSLGSSKEQPLVRFALQ